MKKHYYLFTVVLLSILFPNIVYSQKGHIKYINRSTQRDAEVFQKYDEAQVHEDVDYRHEYTAAAYATAKSTSSPKPEVVTRKDAGAYVASKSTVSKSTTTSQAKPVNVALSSNVAIKSQKLVPDIGYENKLNKYNVVIAALTKKAGVDQLKKVFGAEKEPVVVAKNKDGYYYFILGSFANPNQAMAKREALKKKYVNSKTATQRQAKYGIPLSDIWILSKE